jgi:hypothetical protein
MDVLLWEPLSAPPCMCWPSVVEEFGHNTSLKKVHGNTVTIFYWIKRVQNLNERHAQAM